MKITVDEKREYQIFSGFGASGAWWAQEVGGWSDIDHDSGKSIRDRISELLFSRENGIGLTIYRYNIGAGSAGQNNPHMKIENPLRKTESFLSQDGSYDWSRDKAAVYMMKKAVSDGAEEVILFVNSPEVSLTKNGTAHTTANRPFTENLSRRNYRAFAKYCLDVTEHFIGENVPVKYLSPVNEPLWIWNGGQEGCHYRPSSVRRVFRVFCEEADKRPGLGSLKFSGAENGDIRWYNKAYTRAILGDKKIKSRITGIDVHSYCHPLPLPFINRRTDYLVRFRKYADRKFNSPDIRVSEWTHMKGGRDSSMTSALEAAEIMYEDITLLNASSWQHWIAVSEVDYCDGLIYINMDDKTFEITKRYYVTGNFSKFILPGAKRIFCECGDKTLKSVSFRNNDNIAAVIINQGTEQKVIEFSGKIAYLTDDFNNLAPVYPDENGKLMLPARSVTTLIFPLN